jgi:hypothetical protein
VRRSRICTHTALAGWLLANPSRRGSERRAVKKLIGPVIAAGAAAIVPGPATHAGPKGALEPSTTGPRSCARREPSRAATEAVLSNLTRHGADMGPCESPNCFRDRRQSQCRLVPKPPCRPSALTTRIDSRCISRTFIGLEWAPHVRRSSTREFNQLNRFALGRSRRRCRGHRLPISMRVADRPGR